IRKPDIDRHHSNDGGLSKVSLRVQGPPYSNSFTHSITITGTRDPSLSIAITCSDLLLLPLVVRDDD
uniref:Uncharacterized protein n=1 Tax=Amphimedon queenslandica TaxID=400682 RepID=A0A1X7SIP4_AMPQE